MNRRRNIFITAAILGLAILIPVLHHYQLRLAVNTYIAQLKARGEPMELSEVIPPPAPQDKNGVPLIWSSLTNLENKYKSIPETNGPPAMREVSPGKAMVGWQQPNIISLNEDDLASESPTVRLWTNTWDDLGAELATAKDDLENFQKLTNYPFLDFNLDYGSKYAVRLQHLGWIKDATQWLRAAALYDLHERKTTEACAEARAILAIVKGQTEEPLEDSQLFRSVIASIGAGATWEILQDPNVSEPELASLQQDWESVEFVSPSKRAFLMQRVIGVHAMEHCLQDPSLFWSGVNGNDQEIDRKIFKCIWQWFWAYADEKRMMQTYQILADATRVAETNHSFQNVQWLVRTNFNRLGLDMPFPQEGTFRIDIDPIATHWVMTEDAFDSFELLKRSMVFETAKNMTIVAIALKRYELQHHQLPATLDDLTPTFLKTIPLDYMNGQVLHYRRNADGTFLLYSVGENGVDDGGKPSPHKWWEFYWMSHTLDMVWPQPASQEEIQKYYHKPAESKT